MISKGGREVSKIATRGPIISYIRHLRITKALMRSGIPISGRRWNRGVALEDFHESHDMMLLWCKGSVLRPVTGICIKCSGRRNEITEKGGIEVDMVIVFRYPKIQRGWV